MRRASPARADQLRVTRESFAVSPYLWLSVRDLPLLSIPGRFVSRDYGPRKPPTVGPYLVRIGSICLHRLIQAPLPDDWIVFHSRGNSCLDFAHGPAYHEAEGHAAA